jgi:hypothetical protein
METELESRQRTDRWVEAILRCEKSIKTKMMSELWELTLTHNNRTQKFGYHDEDIVKFFQRGKPHDKYEREQLRRLVKEVKDTFMRCAKECLEQNKKAILENDCFNDSYLKVL